MIVATSLAAIERLFTFFDEKPEVADRPGAPPLKVNNGRVVFEHVRLRLQAARGRPDSHQLDDVNLTVPAGTTVALVGRSGAGKTTIAA